MKKDKSALINSISVYLHSISLTRNKAVSFLFVLFSISSLLNSTIIEIYNDGTGDYPTIQAGINASTNGDTVLVYQGTYYENVNLNGHQITLASLELITGDEAYADSTIINGNQNGSCITLRNAEQNVVIRGFTVTNGYDAGSYGFCGGGLKIWHETGESEIYVYNCIFSDNYGQEGGGAIFVGHLSYLFLSGVSIYNNYAASGGGIMARDECNLMFDEENKCNIYNNFASSGSDILVIDAINDIHVVLDTFTVLEPDEYFAKYVQEQINDGEMTFDIQSGWLEQVNQDVYVATNGDDNNSGTSPEEPFRTIAWALHKVISDSLEPNTVNIAPGTYSQDLNNQIFPIGAKSYVSIAGSSENETILLNTYNPFILASYYTTNINIENLTFHNTSDTFKNAISFSHCTDVLFRDIIIEDCISVNSRIMNLYSEETSNYLLVNVIIRNNIAEGCAGLQVGNRINLTMKNCILDNNHSVGNIDTGWVSNFYCNVLDSLKIENCVFSNSSTLREDVSTIAIGRINVEFEASYKIINSAFYNNESPSNFCIILGGFSESTKEILNCTFANNNATSATLAIDGNVNIYNTIMQNDPDYEIYLGDFSLYNNISNLYFSHCNIQGGEEGINNENNVNDVNWLDSNIDEDPLFLGEGDYPYALLEDSSCIDVGTLVLPVGIELPEFDLAGNPRIYGDSIDMGAYEWNPDISNSNSFILEPENMHLSNFPNPFNPSTMISFSIPEESKVELSVYNLKGQKVKQLSSEQFQKGEHTIVWFGDDEHNKPVSSGIYLYKIKAGKQESVNRMLLLK